MLVGERMKVPKAIGAIVLSNAGFGVILLGSINICTYNVNSVIIYNLTVN